MELEYTNCNDEIALTIKANPIEIFLLKNVNIEFKNESCTILFKEDALIVSKTRSSIT